MNEQIRASIRKIQRRIADLEQFDPEAVTSRFHDPHLIVLQADIEGTLVDVFGPNSAEIRRYSAASRLDTAAMAPGIGLAEVREGLKVGREKSVALLKSAIRYLEERLEEPQSSGPRHAEIGERDAEVKNVFVVHGHDEAAKHEVARFLENAGMRAIILHEQTSEGKTLIEKFEKHSAVAAFAVVLLSPDDLGAEQSKADDLQPRARQNVILELGYFCGVLGRERVIALKKGDIEIPTDYIGVEYVPMDAAGAWKAKLAQELSLDPAVLIGASSNLRAGFSADRNSASSPQKLHRVAGADVRVRLEGPGRSARFVIENRGPGDALNVNFWLNLDDQGESPLVKADYDRKLPISILREGDSITLLAALTFGSGTHFEGHWSWEEDDGQHRSRKGPVSL